MIDALIGQRSRFAAQVRTIRLVALASATVALPGCATVVRGTHETFRIVSTPSGAVAQLSSGESCVTPCAVELPRANPVQVRFAKPGFVTQTVAVRSVGTGAGGIGLVSNAVLGGIVGASVDLSSGAMRSLTPNPLKVELAVVPAVPAPTVPPAEDTDLASVPPAPATDSPPAAAATP